MWIYLKKSKSCRLIRDICILTAKNSDEILAIGIPHRSRTLCRAFTVTVTNRSLLVYGNNKVAAMGIVMKVNMIAALILVGFAFGCQPLVGYNYGGKE